MSNKKGLQAQVTGFLTVKDSAKLSMEQKQAAVKAPEGQVRKVRKILVDPETGEQVVLEGKLYIGGFDKAKGEYAKDRKQSLTCRIAFKVANLETFLTNAAATPEEKADEKANDEMLAALTS